MTRRKIFNHRARRRIAAALAVSCCVCALAVGAQPAFAQSEPAADRSNDAGEIVVTARKTEERLLDVPAPITAISGSDLVQSNQVTLRDFYTRVPGLSLTDSGVFGGSIISIRGITSGVFNDNTVAFLVNDVSFGGSTANGPTEVVPEIDPSDLARVEVLRGPQGTLYGASTIGGLLKYVTREPDLRQTSGQIRGGINDTRGGDEIGYDFGGSLNLPIGTEVAVRASAFSRRLPGYIDDPVHGRQGVNSTDIRGGRLALLLQPSEQFRVVLGAILQDTDADGTSYVNQNIGSGDLIQSTVPGSTGFRRKATLLSANAQLDLGAIQLSSVTGYQEGDNVFRTDYSPLFGSSIALPNFGVTGVPTVTTQDIRKFTQELRADVRVTDGVNLLVGGYFNHERTATNQQIFAADFMTGARAGKLGEFDNPSTFREFAVFGTATFTLSDRFDVQIGGRQSHNRQTLTSTNSGILAGGSQAFVRAFPTIRSSADAFTYLVSPRFRINRDLMIYGRIASGYRPGGTNTGAVAASRPQFGPDRTVNYEVGIRGNLIGRLLYVDASAYHIDWSDIIINLRDPALGLGYKDNAGRARSQGVDFALTLRPATGTTISGWISYNDAEFARDLPATAQVRALRGDRLPFSPRLTSNISIDQTFEVGSDSRVRVGASYSHVGQRLGGLTATRVRTEFPAYDKFDLRASFERGPWTVSAFVNNLTDERGILNGGAVDFLPNSLIYIEPRSAGIAVTRNF